jgi:hypothetical protein
MNTRGNNERSEKNANEAAKLAHPCRKKDLVTARSSRHNDINIGIMTEVA